MEDNVIREKEECKKLDYVDSIIVYLEKRRVGVRESEYLGIHI